MTTLGDQPVRLSVFLTPLGLWMLMAVIAVLHDGLRDLVLIPRLGDYPGHVINTTLLMVAIIVISFLFFSRTTTAYTRAELALVGVGWTVLPVGFEFLVGYV